MTVTKSILILTILFTAAVPAAFSADTGADDSRARIAAAEVEWLQKLDTPLHPAPNPRPDLQPRGRGTDWQTMIDAVWGEGLSGAEQLAILNSWSHTIEWDFACFVNHDVDFAGLCQPYLAEVSGGVSQGRFQGILSRVSMALQNGHTDLYNWDVVGTTPARGVPLLVAHMYADTYTVGACLTVGQDGVFVYDVVDNHPLGLEVGDVILGYDGRPWAELLAELLAAELPIGGHSWLSSDESFDYGWQVAVANNWHLFDTMDVRKFTTGEIVHLSTQLMEDASPTDLHIACYDILDETLPAPTSPGWVTWGVAETDTFRIGMIRCDRWAEQADTYWENACNTMVQDGDLDGLIIDFRTNMGGNMFLSDDGLDLLFNQGVNTIDFGMRSDPDDHLAMSRVGNTLYYRIWGQASTYFDKPIAVLLGPKAISSGDQVALRMTFHPMAKTFGKPTSGTFDAPVNHIVPGQSQFYGRYSEANAGFWNVPDEYLSSRGVPVDYPVWLEPQDCRDGVDTVVERARHWIMTGLSDAPEHPGSSAFRLLGAAPNPFNPRTTIRFELPEKRQVSLQIYDVSGRRVRSLLSGSLMAAGSHGVEWDGLDSRGRTVSAGVYFFGVRAGNDLEIGRMMLLK